MKLLLDGSGRGKASCRVLQGEKRVISVRDGQKRVGCVNLRHKWVKPYEGDIRYELLQIRVHTSVVFFAPVEHISPINLSRDNMPMIKPVRIGESWTLRPKGMRQSVTVTIVNVSSKREQSLWVEFEVTVIQSR